MNISNRFRGKKAQKEGKTFEQLIINCCNREKLACKKSDAPLRQAPGKWGKTIFWREKSGADFIIGNAGVAIMFDAKSLDSDCIPFAKIKKHQIDELKIWNDAGFRSGYLINFRKIDQIVFIDTRLLLTLKPRQSLNAKMGEYLGAEFSFSLKRLFT